LKYRKGRTQPLQQATLLVEHEVMRHTQTEGIIDMDQDMKISSTQIDKASPKTLTHLSIGRRARKHHTKDSGGSTGSSSSIPIYNTTKSRRPEGTYAPRNTKRIKDGRQQIISKRGGGVSQ
jgi:hypothetical protein